MFIDKIESKYDTICDECQSILLTKETVYIVGVGGGLSTMCKNCIKELKTMAGNIDTNENVIY